MSVLRKKFDWPLLVIVGCLSLWGLIIFYPFYNSFLVSIVPMEVYTKTPFLFYPPKLDFGSYKFVLGWDLLTSGLLVTTVVTILGTIYNLILTVMTAFALSKPIPGRKFFNYMIIFTMYFSGGLIPFYLIVKNLGLKNNIMGMVAPTGIYIMYMLIMRSYFYTIPEEIEESAKLDGASMLRILFSIIIPLSKPMLATIGLYYAVDRWNEWWLGNLFVTKVNLMPLQLIIRNMLQDSRAMTQYIPTSNNIVIFPEGLKMASIIITMLPIVIVYPFLQKYFVKGLVLGSVKG